MASAGSSAPTQGDSPDRSEPGIPSSRHSRQSSMPDSSGSIPRITEAPPPLKRDEYTVGWFAALEEELTAAILMLDARHQCPSDFIRSHSDTNTYVWGKIANRNIVITPATDTTALCLAFPKIKFGLMVGIGSGIRREGFDVRLGDVVINQIDRTTSGVYRYSLYQARSGNDSEAASIDTKPSIFLQNCQRLLKAQHSTNPSRVPEYLNLAIESMKKSPNRTPGYVHQGVENDRLFMSTFSHVSDSPQSESAEEDFDADDLDPDTPSLTCPHCPSEKEVKRDARLSGIIPQFHHGNIASVNTPIRDAEERDMIVKRVPGKCICLDMGAAGLMNRFPCLVIRGICDYADSHKNDRWKPYAALTAAAYAKVFLETVQDGEMRRQQQAQAKELEKWLSPLDPSMDYRTAIDERNEGVAGTGSWFLENPDFVKWKSTKNSFLWLHGPMGYGKTVLVSTVIEHLGSKASMVPDRIILYYFFNKDLYDFFNKDDKWDLSQRNLIRSLVHQLCQKDGRAMKDLLMLRSETSGSQPSDDSLSQVFNSMVRYFNQTVIIIDGLNEVEETKRPEVFRWIKDTMSSAVISDIRILVSSRFEHDIEANLPDLHQVVQLLPKMIQGDVKAYVHKKIYEEESELSRWCQLPEVQLEIEEALTGKAPER